MVEQRMFLNFSLEPATKVAGEFVVLEYDLPMRGPEGLRIKTLFSYEYINYFFGAESGPGNAFVNACDFIGLCLLSLAF
jgi:hypothetical protein